MIIKLFGLKITITKSEQYDTLTSQMERMTLDERIEFIVSMPELFPECVGADRATLENYAK